MKAVALALVLVPWIHPVSNALAASSGAAPVCKGGKVVSYAPCDTVKQCDALSRDCPPPPKGKR